MARLGDFRLASPAEMESKIGQVYTKGLKQAQRFVDFGSELWNLATQGMEYGMFYLAGAPNMGKSAIITSKYLDILAANEDVDVLDFTLDETIGRRLHRVAANLARLRINDIAIAGSLDENAKFRRAEAFNLLSSYAAKGRLVISESADVRLLVEEIKQFRQRIDPERKLVVTLDGVHNVGVQGNFYNQLREQEEIGKRLEEASKENRAIIMASAHIVKSHGQRNFSYDDLKGTGYFTYGASIIGMVFCEVKVRRNAAQVFWMLDGRNEKMPIIELNVVKNKESEFNGIIFHTFVPELARVEEQDAEEQFRQQAKVFSAHVAH